MKIKFNGGRVKLLQTIKYKCSICKKVFWFTTERDYRGIIVLSPKCPYCGATYGLTECNDLTFWERIKRLFN